MKNFDCDTVTVEEAAAMIGVSKPTARKLLGEPNNIEITSRGLPRYVYLRCVAESAAKMRRCELCNRRDKGLHKCRSCPHYFTKEELTSGKCADCRAYDLLRGLACHGDCFKCPVPDCNILKKIEAALHRLKEKYSIS